MAENFTVMLAEGGKSNSLGRAEEVVQLVLRQPSLLEELYQCLFEEDAWLRMRAADALEKICRVHPDWLKPYIDRLFEDFGQDDQASVQWHLAQILGEVDLTYSQRQKAAIWLTEQLQTTEVDWIVSANVMETLTHFAHEGHYTKEDLAPLLKRQQEHHSNSVVKRATKLLASLE